MNRNTAWFIVADIEDPAVVRWGFSLIGHIVATIAAAIADTGRFRWYWWGTRCHRSHLDGFDSDTDHTRAAEGGLQSAGAREHARRKRIHTARCLCGRHGNRCGDNNGAWADVQADCGDGDARLAGNGGLDTSLRGLIVVGDVAAR